MAQRRRRHLRRNALIFLGSLVGHIVVFYLANSELQFYQLPQPNEHAVQVEIVPEQVPPPEPFPLITPKPAPQQQPPSTPPTPAPQPQPAPTPQPSAPQVTIVKPAPVAAAPTPARTSSAPAPAPKPAPTPVPLAPATPAPQPGPPQAAPHVTLSQTAPKTVAAPKIVLHKSREEATSLAPPVSIPGAVFAPTPAPAPAGAAPGGAAAGGGLAGLPSGQLPGFGRGLRGGRLGCVNAAALHLSAAEQAKCDQAYGEGAYETPVLDPIGSAKRAELDKEAAQQSASQRYRDTTVGGTGAQAMPGQPKVFQKPGE
jgi:hypothetical protein